MKQEEFEKIDLEQEIIFCTKIYNGETKKPNGIILLVAGVFVIIFIPIMLSLNLSFGSDFTKYFFLIIFLVFGIVFICGGALYLRQYRNYKKIVDQIKKDGLVTTGCVTQIQCKRIFTGIFNKFGYKYRIEYVFTDYNGKERKDEILFCDANQTKYKVGDSVKVAFTAEDSAMLEFFDLSDYINE